MAKDGLSRLSTLIHTMPSPYANWSQSYSLSYTASSQLNQSNASNGGYTFAPTAKTVRATPNGLNQLATSGGATLSYDQRGNLTFDGVNAYGYDTLNHLTTVNGSTTLGYDSRDRLISVTPSGGAQTQFVYVGDQLALEFQVTGGSWTILRRYVPGVGEDRPIAMYNSGTLASEYELLEDHAGSIIGVNDSSGNDYKVNTYDDYGVQGSGNWGRYQYTGQVWLSEVGLYNYKARMYSPSLGRFMQTDPVGYKDGPNWYAYVHNDPVNHGDPSGTAGLPCAEETYCDSSAGGIPQGAEPGSGEFRVAATSGIATAEQAVRHVGQGGYGYYDPSDESRGRAQGIMHGICTAKCNDFVWDVLKESGHPAGRMAGGRIPSAEDWGDPKSKIPGYSPVTRPDVGAVMSNGHHVGIYVPLAPGKPGSVSAAAPFHHTGFFGAVVHNDWGFRGDEGHITYWEPSN